MQWAWVETAGTCTPIRPVLSDRKKLYRLL